MAGSSSAWRHYPRTSARGSARPRSTSEPRAVLGRDIPPLTYVRASSRFGDLEALVSAPGVEKSSGKFLFTFVNGRLVRDRVMRYGILRGYHSHLLKGKFPLVVLHLRSDPALIDVNVHPAKTEVRFQYPDEVQNLIALGIRDQLRSGAWAAPEQVNPPSATVSSFTAAGGPAVRREPVVLASTAAEGVERSFNRASASRSILSTRSAGPVMPQTSPGRLGDAPRDPWTPEARPWTTSPVVDRAGIDALLASTSDAPMHIGVPDAVTAPVPESATDRVPDPALNWPDLDYLGSFAKCYLLFGTPTHLLAVDQHAFHERILYERLLRDASLLTQSQRLLVPESIDLAPAQVAQLRLRQAALSARGFTFHIDSDTTLEVKAVPSLLAGRDLPGLFADLGEDISAFEVDGGHKEPTDSNAELARLILANMACHAAVRAGEELPDNELKQLLGRRRRCRLLPQLPARSPRHALVVACAGRQLV